MALSPQDIVRKEFREAFRGYNQTDVDLFLDEIVEELTRLSDENQKMRVRLAALQQELGRFRESRTTRAQQQMASRYAELAPEETRARPEPPRVDPPRENPRTETPAVPPLRQEARPAERPPVERPAERPDPFAPRVERPAAPPPPPPATSADPFGSAGPVPASQPAQPVAPTPAPPAPPAAPPAPPAPGAEPRTEPLRPVSERWTPPEDRESGSFWDRS